MKTVLATLMISLVVASGVSCRKSGHSSSQPIENTAATKQDGLSYGTAIKLTAKTASEGIVLEHDWIGQNLPGAHFHGNASERTDSGEEIVTFAHRTDIHEGRVYSVFHLQMPDGQPRMVYFDASEYFGK